MLSALEDPRLRTYRELCERTLDQLLPAISQRPTELHEAMRYSALAPGKRLRPCLVMASAEAVRGSKEFVAEAACATELIHCFSLIHDDLPCIDDDDLRRGLPTCHVKFGEAIAVLAGDALFALAFRSLSRIKGEPSAVVASLEILADASGSDGLVGGEVVDVLTEGQPYTPEDLDFIHSRKTGVLIRACCQIGGVLSGATSDQLADLHVYGEKVGLAFQIADDLLNETSTADQLGKATQTDVARAKATYPALYGHVDSQRAAERFVAEAIEAVSGLPDPAVLKQLASYAIERLH